ncbi:hypothetical protein TeGR_g13172 [Tetraparma gracilis]|uniref:Uncharacterized protein n=1 Tax=Tetraparma gracilis TaxID=2962635 RepID=A0ABQ6MRF5_9STRA|nr:hypothetical protein TeGR_g13172 [Tetraparma gracilis]
METLPRSALQALAKKAGVAANQKTAAILAALRAVQACGELNLEVDLSRGDANDDDAAEASSSDSDGDFAPLAERLAEKARANNAASAKVPRGGAQPPAPGRPRRGSADALPDMCYVSGPSQPPAASPCKAAAFLGSLRIGDGTAMPTHPQHTGVHCSAYALWNAAEVAAGRSLPRPPFVDIELGRNGISTTRLLERRDAARFLADLQLRAVPVVVHGRGTHESVLLRALQEGVLLVGGAVSMATYHSAHHHGREPAHWRGVRVPGLLVENHSFAVVGSVQVVGFGRCLLVRDSQREVLFGVHGCALLSMSRDFEGKLEECFVLKRVK